jgi:hypothetical protein
MLGGDATKETIIKIQIGASYLIVLLIYLLHKNTRHTKDVPDSNPVAFSSIT